MTLRRARFMVGIAGLLVLAVGCAPKEEAPEVAEVPEAAFEPEILSLPADPSSPDGYAPLDRYAAMAIPEDNPLTAEKAALGRQLYYDYRLSGDGSRSCYHCHVVEKGLTDGLPTAIGAFEKALTRSSPSMWNIGFHSEFYWDGRAPSLEKQAFAAWKGGNMGAAEPQTVVDQLNGLEGYRKQFQAVFGEDATVDNIPMALGSYMRTIVSGDTAWDRWQAGDESAVSDAAKRGFETFTRWNCTECHAGALLTDQQFHNVGIGMDAEGYDVGRYKITELDQNRGAFKTPTLRDITKSGPYFHNGSVADLEEAVRLMANGGTANEWLDAALEPRNPTDEEVADVMAFLATLDNDVEMPAPPLPQS